MSGFDRVAPSDYPLHQRDFALSVSNALLVQLSAKKHRAGYSWFARCQYMALVRTRSKIYGGVHSWIQLYCST